MCARVPIAFIRSHPLPVILFLPGKELPWNERRETDVNMYSEIRIRREEKEGVGGRWGEGGRKGDGETERERRKSSPLFTLAPSGRYRVPCYGAMPLHPGTVAVMAFSRSLRLLPSIRPRKGRREERGSGR